MFCFTSLTHRRLKRDLDSAEHDEEIVGAGFWASQRVPETLDPYIEQMTDISVQIPIHSEVYGLGSIRLRRGVGDLKIRVPYFQFPGSEPRLAVLLAEEIIPGGHGSGLRFGLPG